MIGTWVLSILLLHSSAVLNPLQNGHCRITNHMNFKVLETLGSKV